MKIEKFLSISSLDQLYNILNSSSNLSESNPLFLSFIDYMYEYYNGCKCMEDEYLNLAKNEYKNISKSIEAKLEIVSYFECDGIRFCNL